MANSNDPIRDGLTEEAKIQPTNNDPTPEARKGDARFLPVVIIAGIALIVILIAGILFLKGKGTKIVPEGDQHPNSSLIYQPASAA